MDTALGDSEAARTQLAADLSTVQDQLEALADVEARATQLSFQLAATQRRLATTEAALNSTNMMLQLARARTDECYVKLDAAQDAQGALAPSVWVGRSVAFVCPASLGLPTDPPPAPTRVHRLLHCRLPAARGGVGGRRCRPAGLPQLAGRLLGGSEPHRRACARWGCRHCGVGGWAVPAPTDVQLAERCYPQPPSLHPACCRTC